MSFGNHLNSLTGEVYPLTLIGRFPFFSDWLAREWTSVLTVDILAMITSKLILNETFTVRCNSGDSIFTLIPVRCLGGCLNFLARGKKAKSRVNHSLQLRIKSSLSYRNQDHRTERAKTTEGDGDEVPQGILMLGVWRKNWDTW